MTWRTEAAGIPEAHVGDVAKNTFIDVEMFCGDKPLRRDRGNRAPEPLTLALSPRGRGARGPEPGARDRSRMYGTGARRGARGGSIC
jgi:hypothetical protein